MRGSRVVFFFFFFFFFFFIQSCLRSKSIHLDHGMNKRTVYLVVFAEDLNVEIDTHVIRV